MDEESERLREHLTKPKLGQALRLLRKAEGLTQVEVSRRARLNGSRLAAEQISKWENGHDWPSFPSLVDFLDALGGDFSDLQQVLTGVEVTAVAENGIERLARSPEMRAAVAAIIGESEEVDGLRRRVRDLEKKLPGKGGPADSEVKDSGCPARCERT